MAADEDKEGDDRRIAAIMQIAESLAADDVRDGYSQTGAATSGPFRFKWTARLQEDGRFVVDETVGGGAVAVSSRPMLKDAVLPYIEERQRQLQAKVDDAKRELAKIQGSVVVPLEGQKAASDDAPDPLQMFDQIRQLLKDSK
jgi:hypothetical protein